MRTLILGAGALLTLPLMVLNWTASIIGGIWLAINREWYLLAFGIGALLLAKFALTILLMPGFGIGMLGYKFNAPLLRYPLIGASVIYNLVLITLWTIVFFTICISRPHGNAWPYILWAYAAATTPWVQFGREEIKDQGTIMWIIGLELGAIGAMISVLVGNGYQSPFGMVIFFVPFALAGMGITLVMEDQKRNPR